MVIIQVWIPGLTVASVLFYSNRPTSDTEETSVANQNEEFSVINYGMVDVLLERLNRTKAGACSTCKV